VKKHFEKSRSKNTLRGGQKKEVKNRARAQGGKRTMGDKDAHTERKKTRRKGGWATMLTRRKHFKNDHQLISNLERGGGRKAWRLNAEPKNVCPWGLKQGQVYRFQGKNRHLGNRRKWGNHNRQCERLEN